MTTIQKKSYLFLKIIFFEKDIHLYTIIDNYLYINRLQSV